MRHILLIILISSFLFSYSDYKDVPIIDKIIAYDSEHCYGSNTSKKVVFNLDFYERGYWNADIDNMLIKYGDYNDVNPKYYKGILCSKNPRMTSSWGVNSGTKIVIYDDDDDENMIYLKYWNTATEDLPSTCKQTPDNNELNGLKYQSKANNDASCQTLYSNSGSTSTYLFANPNLDPSCDGFCYFNDKDPDDETPPLENCIQNPIDNIISGFAYQSKSASNSACVNTYNTLGDGLGYSEQYIDTIPNCYYFCYYNTPDDITDPPDPSDEENEIKDIIPYIDELEEKNEAINNSLIALNTNLNTQFGTVNNNTQTLNTTMQTLNNSLQVLDDTLQTLNADDSNNGGGENPNYDGVTDGFNINPNIDGELTNFKSNIESSIQSSFSSYSDIFGFGNYGSAPAPITINLLGKQFTLFDIKYLNPYIDQIRNIFVIVAYIFGLFLVFRGN